MSTQKPGPKGKGQPSEQQDDLELGAETVKDLDVAEKDAARLRGGGKYTQSIFSDVRLKHAVAPVEGALARIRKLRGS